MNNRNPFCVIRYKIECVFTRTICWQWAIVQEVNGKAQYRDVKKADAMRVIEENGLTLKHHDSNGSVYDDGTFYDKYKNGNLKV